MNNEVKYNPLYTILIPIKLAQALNDVKQPHNPVPTPMNRFLSGFIFRHWDNSTFDTPSMELIIDELNNNIPSNNVNDCITHSYGWISINSF